MRPTPISLSALLVAALLAAPGAFAFADDEDGDRVIYANSPKDRYEARIEMLENQAEMRRSQCRRSSGMAGRSYCTQEIEKELREKKRAAKAKYEEELAAAGKGK